MRIDKDQRAKRDAARHKKTEAVDSFVAVQKDEVVHSHQDGIKTVTRAGVVIRNDKNVGHEAMQRARELIDSVESVTFKDNRATTGTNDDWFESNQASVEQQIKERIDVRKNSQVSRDGLVSRSDLITNRRKSTKLDELPPIDDKTFDGLPDFQESIGGYVDFDNYRPVVDDGAEEYIPLSER